MLKIKVNGRLCAITSATETPLLYVLRNELGVMTPKFGCGLAQCGACSVLLDDTEFRSCITPVSAAVGMEVTTVEGLPARWARQNGRSADAMDGTVHPVQEAWIAEQVPQCGYCQFGMMIKATELLEHTPHPTDEQIKAAFTTSGASAHLCRCGSYAAIMDGVRHASMLMAKKRRGGPT
jgi:isoquinoline 1-oxidoreductase alpha subunit